MKYVQLLPLAALALAVACSDTATNPTSIDRPLFVIQAGTFTDPNALAVNTPGGGHLQSGAIGCTVGADLVSLSCSSYEVAGVGNTNADLSLVANYSATIDCTNHGGNLVETHTSTFSAGVQQTLSSSKNGRLRVGTASASPFSAPQVCPNNNWKPSIRSGTLVLTSFSYTLTFAGFSSPAVTIAQS